LTNSQLTENEASSVEKAWLEYNQEFESNEKSNIRNDFWSYGEYELVGHGKQTSPKCGTFNKYMGCLNYQAHNQARFFTEGLEKNSVFVKPIYHSCDKPSCPVCYKHGWAVRDAYRMEDRLKVASNRFVLPVEHIVREQKGWLGCQGLRQAQNSWRNLLVSTKSLFDSKRLQKITCDNMVRCLLLSKA